MLVLVVDLLLSIIILHNQLNLSVFMSVIINEEIQFGKIDVAATEHV